MGNIYDDGLASGAYFIRLKNQSLQKVLNIFESTITEDSTLKYPVFGMETLDG